MKYEDLETLPDNIVITDKQYPCVICGVRVITYDADIDEYICGEECTKTLEKFRKATLVE